MRYLPPVKTEQHRHHGQHLGGDMPPLHRHPDIRTTHRGHWGGDDRIGRRARHGVPSPPGRPEHHGHRAHEVGPSYGGIATSVEQPGKPRHLWIWTGGRYVHLEPKGQREIAPGHLVKHVGHPAPGHFGAHWHVTTPSLHAVHPPPPPRPGMKPHAIPGVSTHVAGHYGWSGVLGKHVWIKSHDNLSLDPSQLPAHLRGPIMQAIKSSLGHTHAHTAWGVSGHRVWVIPGHWVLSKATQTWTYVERHIDAQGKPHAVTHSPSQAPSAAFGPRPAYLPPLAFWPAGGQFRDAHGRRPSNAPGTVAMPPHARYAAANGLLTPTTPAPTSAAEDRRLMTIGLRAAIRDGLFPSTGKVALSSLSAAQRDQLRTLGQQELARQKKSIQTVQAIGARDKAKLLGSFFGI